MKILVKLCFHLNYIYEKRKDELLTNGLFLPHEIKYPTTFLSSGLYSQVEPFIAEIYALFSDVKKHEHNYNLEIL